MVVAVGGMVGVMVEVSRGGDWVAVGLKVGEGCWLIVVAGRGVAVSVGCKRQATVSPKKSNKIKKGCFLPNSFIVFLFTSGLINLG